MLKIAEAVVVTVKRNPRKRAGRLSGPESLEQRRVLAAVLSLEGPTEPLMEGEQAAFTLRLSERAPRAEAVFVTTRGGTATLGVDYAAPQRLQVIFAPGETVKTFSIATLAEAVPQREPAETFFVTATPANRALAGAQTRMVTIVDAVPRPVVSVADIAVDEGLSGITPAEFTIRLGSAYPRIVTVAYATRDGSATVADNDYAATSGTVTFQPGQTSQIVTVNVNGDRRLEPDETFSLFLSAPTNATIGRGSATCTIRNDEVDASGFQITLNYLTPMQPAWTRAVQRAVAKWESIIVGDVPSVVYQGRFIDDFEVSVTFQQDDPNVLGYARFLEQRPGAGGLPFLGEMVMNSLYAGLPGIYDTIVHELAHALGFTPGMWTQIGLLGGTVADPRFLGSNAVREFNTIFSTTATGVPLYEMGTPGDGSYAAHWRDSVFGNEAMVSAGDPRITGIPVSRITVAHFADLGYSVSLAAADPYTPPVNRTFVAASPTGAAGLAWTALANVNRPLVHVVARPMAQVPGSSPTTGSSGPAASKPRPVVMPRPAQPSQANATATTRPTVAKTTAAVVTKSVSKLSTRAM